MPATERVIRPATEGSFPASHASSRSHNSSTRAQSSTHRCRRHRQAWTLDYRTRESQSEAMTTTYSRAAILVPLIYKRLILMLDLWDTGTCLGVYKLRTFFFWFFNFIRHEERTWSLEHSDSVLSDSPGMMSSSVGTSNCSSPACVEARARRAAHCGYSDSHRPGLQYGDSFDSLGDSPHSDRWGTCSLS